MHIVEFQEMMRRLFFHKDSKRGVKGTYEWLVDEVEELGAALDHGNMDEAKQEFADVIAWLASLANVTNIDLEQAVLAKYHSVCPRCKSSPCMCSSVRRG